MLLIHHNKTEIKELHSILEQCMRTDDDSRLTHADVQQGLSPASGAQ